MSTKSGVGVVKTKLFLLNDWFLVEFVLIFVFNKLGLCAILSVWKKVRD